MKKSICIVLSVILILSACVALVACKNKNYIADNTEHYDAITTKLKLSKSYEGKSFMVDGIGIATVDVFTDGDTTRFKTGEDTVIIRYYCIDTPESTGGVEKWGKAASNFVKEQLSQATMIVLESTTGGKPDHDSYGTRYLGYVWYKTADSDFKNLNLELVENGYSDNKAVNTEKYAYYDYFKEANDFARSIKLRLYSELDDPLYSKDPIPMTIKDFTENLEAYYNVDQDSGSKVIFTAYLKELRISSTGTFTFTAEEYDPQTGKIYSIPVYCGYASSSSTQMKIGHLYRLIGDIQKHYETFQVTNISYSSILLEELPNGSYPVQKDYYLTFDSSKKYIAQYSASLYSNVTVVSASEKNENGKSILSIVGNAYKCTGESDGKNTYATEATQFTFVVDVSHISTDLTKTYTAGTAFSVAGYQFTAKSGEISVLNLTDIKIK